MKMEYVVMCQEKAQKKARKSRKAKGNVKRETVKGILGLSAFLIAASIVGRMDYNVEMAAQAKEKSAKETVVSASTVRRVYGITMDNGNTLYTIESDGNVYSWYDEDASEMADYTPVQLVYDTMGTYDMSDDEIINVVPVNSNSDTQAVLKFVFEGGE